jgi:hypothetical protein
MVPGRVVLSLVWAKSILKIPQNAAASPSLISSQFHFRGSASGLDITLAAMCGTHGRLVTSQLKGSSVAYSSLPMGTGGRQED